MIAEPPDPNPPKPYATFARHSAPNGVDFSDAAFGFEGDAFVALFGDLTPVTARLTTPSGFKVVRVDMRTREVVDFAVNKINGPASRLPHAGFERPSHCQFGPDGNLYVVDFGAVSIAPRRAASGCGRTPAPCGASAVRPDRQDSSRRRPWSSRPTPSKRDSVLPVPSRPRSARLSPPTGAAAAAGELGPPAVGSPMLRNRHTTLRCRNPCASTPASVISNWPKSTT